MDTPSRPSFAPEPCSNDSVCPSTSSFSQSTPDNCQPSASTNEIPSFPGVWAPGQDTGIPYNMYDLDMEEITEMLGEITKIIPTHDLITRINK
jgi:hypothetical protein